jgi:hypothetical protein
VKIAYQAARQAHEEIQKFRGTIVGLLPLASGTCKFLLVITGQAPLGGFAVGWLVRHVAGTAAFVVAAG